jgi:phenylpropionate dioxygenase-like ring-hydroxylating dioxygenase large terminal subunit
MDRLHQTEVMTKLFAHLSAGTTDVMPAEMHHPVSAYVDPAQAASEREALFKRLPLIACHATEVAKANDFLTTDLAGVPVLIVRQAGGGLKAFTNVCRHRGSKVETAERGSKKLFVCPFHAWSYDGEGALRNLPFAPGFCGMDRKDRGLTALPVEERHGLVWVVPTPSDPTTEGGSIDVAAHLGAKLDAELKAWGLGTTVYERHQTFDIPINWKLVVDGFMEDYHLPILHRNTIGPYFQPNLHTFEAFGRHGRMIAARANITKLANKAPEAVDMLRCTAPVYSLFPNAVLVWQNDHFELWTMMPDRNDPLRSHVTARLLAPSVEEAVAQKPLWDKNWKILMDTVEKEDWIASKDIQNGIAGGGQTHFVFGRNEPALQHFHQQVSAAVAAR